MHARARAEQQTYNCLRFGLFWGFLVGFFFLFWVFFFFFFFWSLFWLMKSESHSKTFFLICITYTREKNQRTNSLFIIYICFGVVVGVFTCLRVFSYFVAVFACVCVCVLFLFCFCFFFSFSSFFFRLGGGGGQRGL